MNRHLIIVCVLVAACGKSTAEPTPGTPAVAKATEASPAPARSPAASPPVKATATTPPATPAAPAKPGVSNDEWAPSTGKEMPGAPKPTLDRAVLGKQLATGMELGRTAKDKATCNRAVSLMYPAALGLNLPLNAKTKPVFEVLVRCARKAKRYKVLEIVAKATRKLDVGRASDLATALIGQDRRADATTELATQLAKAPDDAHLLAAQAKLACLNRDFKTCRQAAESALASKRPDAEVESARAMSNVARWYATTMLGDYRAARASIAALPDEAGLHATLTKLLVPAERTKIAIRVDVLDQFPLGVYHLAGGINAAPVELTFGNAAKQDRSLRVEVEVPGVTARAVKSIVVLGRSVEHLTLTPTLLPSFAAADVRAPRKVQADVKVTEGTTVIYESSVPVELLPRDYLPTWQKTSEDTKRPTLHNLGAWVTPNDPSIETFLTAAKQRLRGREAFSGPQSATIPQVQALYDELKARGVSYVMDPSVNSDQFLGQRTRLPAEVLASTNAQCLEGTLLFASLLEALALSPVIVTVPGHAFVGWRPSSFDGKTPPMLFVETTMVGFAPFDKAVSLAMKRVASETKLGSFKTGASQLIHVSALRARGITPQPVR
ncbi:MAG: hypothetical protein M3680_29890 [Myxococcota bacterium]|nr:hypothetical protein [Myxococcota bacterium]